MKAPEDKRQIGQLCDIPRADRLRTLLLAFTAVAIIAADSGAKASEVAAQTAYIEPESDSALGDYRLAPGDRLNIAVYDQPQLSGEFLVDGGGGVVLPLAGAVSLSGLTLVEAQQRIQEQFADGVLVQPAVSVRITEHRPIFVAGSVKNPGRYSFSLGLSVKAAIATAGGKGQRLEQALSVSVSDFITAEQRVRQLEADRVTFLMRKARLEAQRDGRENFVMPVLVGFNLRDVDFDRAYSAESDTFLRLAETYRTQIEALQKQRPRIGAELDAVTDQIAKQEERLGIVTSRLAELEHVFGRGLLRKEVLVNQRIEKALVEAQLSTLEAQVAHLGQTMGELDVKLGDLNASHQRQTLDELRETSQRLLEIDNSIGPARKILDVKAEAAGGESDEPEYTISISRVRDGRLVTFETTEETMLSPGDVIDVKPKRRDSGGGWSALNQAIRSLVESTSSAADGSGP